MAATLDDADRVDDDLIEEDWTPHRRPGRLTAVLVVGIVAAAGFAGGAWAQRSHDRGLTTGAVSAARAGSGGRGLLSGPPGGEFTGAAGFGPGGGAAGPSAGGSGGSPSQAAPVVVGTVASVAAGVLTVKNFAGTAVVVHVPATATVTTVGLAGLRPGATVVVFGAKAADGSVTATSVVSRRAG